MTDRDATTAKIDDGPTRGRARRRHSGAGLLCYARGPDGGDTYYLLGKERGASDWKYGARTWSAFHGAAKDAEDEFDTAAREFVEESLGVVPFLDRDGRRLRDASDIAASLRRGDYAARMDLCYRGRRAGGAAGDASDDASDRVQVCFVKRVPFSPDAPRSFESARAHLLELQRASSALQACRRRCAPHVPLPGAPWLAADSMFAVVVGVEADGDALGFRALTASPDDARASACARGRFDDEDERERCAEGWVAWEALTAGLRGYAAVGGTDTAVAVDRAGGRVVDARVRADHLEKQALQWWSSARLDEMMANGGSHRGEQLRTCFVPGLNVALDFERSAAAARGDACPADRAT